MTDRVKIKYDDCKFVDDCVDYGWDGCKKFTPEPSTPMTNEEWFCGLSTEEKAKVLFILIENIKNGESVYTAIEKAIKDKDVKLPPITEHLFLREWLKQPHTVEG